LLPVPGRVRHHDRGPRAAQRRHQEGRRSRPHPEPGRGAGRVPRGPLERLERGPGRPVHGGVRLPAVGAGPPRAHPPVVGRRPVPDRRRLLHRCPARPLTGPLRTGYRTDDELPPEQRRKGNPMAFLLLIILFTLYFVPTIVAILRKAPDVGTVIVLNFFLGW